MNATESLDFTESSESTQIVNEDGYICDSLTGEVVGHVEVNERYVADTDQRVDWVLEGIQVQDAAIAALSLRLSAITANLTSMIKDHEQRRAWKLSRFSSDLQLFAAAQLEGKKTRTYKSPYGSLSFRTVPGSLKILDPEAALAWAESNAPEAVKVVKSVKVSEIDKAADLPECFEITEPRDAFYIKTGVGGK